MPRKRLISILAVVMLASLFWKTMVGLISTIPREPYTKELLPLGIGLLFVVLFAIYINQKNWRIACLMIGLSEILIYGGTIIKPELGIFLYVVNLAVIIAGLLNVYYFYKSDFEIQLKSKAKKPIYNLILPLIYVLLIMLIFLIFSRQC
jgi:hypothetical protein